MSGRHRIRPGLARIAPAAIAAGAALAALIIIYPAAGRTARQQLSASPSTSPPGAAQAISPASPAVSPPGGARSAGQPGGTWIAPYDYLGADSTPPSAQIIAATGIRRFTLAFILSDGTCNPAWNGTDPLAGGPGQAAIQGIRGAGGDVAVSFGGADGQKLGVVCPSPAALAGAYQRVISAYRLRAIDLDLENSEISRSAVRQRVISALVLIRRDNPALMISITMGSDPSGPDTDGRALIARAAAAGLHVNAWTIMPFDFSHRVPDMGLASVQAAEALKNDLMRAYGESVFTAYSTMGISSLNGRTDAGEIIGAADFETMLRYVRSHHLARFSFWSVNRDRPCTRGVTPDSCSGIAQAPYAFSAVIAGLGG